EKPVATTQPDDWPSEPVLKSLMTDTFDSGNLSHWSFEGTGWALVPHDAGQALQVFNTEVSAQLAQAGRLNGVARAAVLLDHGGVRLDVRRSAAGSYVVTMNSAGQVNLYRASQLLASAQVTPSASGQWRTLRLSAIQDMLRVRVDGVEIIAIQDDS